MKILRRMYDWLIAAASGRYAMAVLFAVAFMESSFFPVPPDVMIIPMVLAARDRAWRIAGMATAASVIGGYFGYAIGFYGYDLIARPILEFYGYLHQFDVFKGYYHEWGRLDRVRRRTDAVSLQSGDHSQRRRRSQSVGIRHCLGAFPRHAFFPCRLAVEKVW